MQRGALAMDTYGIGVLSLIKLPNAAYTNITQSWCADDLRALSMYSNIELYFNFLRQSLPGRGY